MVLSGLGAVAAPRRGTRRRAGPCRVHAPAAWTRRLPASGPRPPVGLPGVASLRPSRRRQPDHARRVDPGARRALARRVCRPDRPPLPVDARPPRGLGTAGEGKAPGTHRSGGVERDPRRPDRRARPGRPGACARASPSERPTNPRVLRELYTEAVTPALYEYGALWETGQVTVAEEHRASEIVSRVVDICSQSFSQSSRTMGRAFVTAAPGERHSLGARIVADVLEIDGWEVDYVGATSPTADLVYLAANTGPDVIGISVAMPSNLPQLATLTRGCARSPNWRAPASWSAAAGDGAGRLAALGRGRRRSRRRRRGRAAAAWRRSGGAERLRRSGRAGRANACCGASCRPCVRGACRRAWPSGAPAPCRCCGSARACTATGGRSRPRSIR